MPNLLNSHDKPPFVPAAEIVAGNFLVELGNPPGVLDPNIPELRARHGGRDGRIVDLSDDAQATIQTIAHAMTVLPAGFGPLKGLHVDLLNSYAHGVTQLDYAESSPYGRRTLTRESQALFQRIGVTNAPSAVYKGILHRIIEPQVWTAVEDPNPNEVLDLYLAAIGLEGGETAVLRELKSGTMKGQRNRILGKLRGATMAHAVAHMFTHPNQDLRFKLLG